jgi:outer membrane protein
MLRQNFVRALVVCAPLALASVAHAQQPPQQPPQPVKLGVINLQRAIVETADIKKAQVDLEAKYRPRTAEMEKVQKELQDIQTQLQSGRAGQGEQELQQRGQRRQRELQRMQEDLQGDVDRERNEILQKAGQRMSEVVRKIADEKGLDVVIDITNIVFFKPALDVTKDAIAAYDKAYPAK